MDTADTVAVVGGTGTLGRQVVAALAARGARPRIVSRHPRPVRDPGQAEWAAVDYASRAGLRDAFAGARAVVIASGAIRDASVVRAVIDTADAGTHLVYVSIVGIDTVPMTYYRRKLDAEKLLAASGRPHSILRATQFHQLVAGALKAAATLPIMPVPRDVPLQPVAPADVAGHLAELALSEPVGRADDVAGPEVADVADLARTMLAARRMHRRIVTLRPPGRIYRALVAGALTSPDRAVGTQTFAQFITGERPADGAAR